jgi:hypothetical protein
MGVVKKMLCQQVCHFILHLQHLLHHPQPTANAATFPARGKDGDCVFYRSLVSHLGFTQGSKFDRANGCLPKI